MNVIDPSQLQELQAQIASTGTPAAAGTRYAHYYINLDNTRKLPIYFPKVGKSKWMKPKISLDSEPTWKIPLSVVVDETGTPVAASGTTEAEDASAVQQVQYYVV